MTTRERRGLLHARTCFVCRTQIPACGGVYHAVLGILTHQGICDRAVVAAERTFDRSARGRRRHPAEWLRQIKVWR